MAITLIPASEDDSEGTIPYGIDEVPLSLLLIDERYQRPPDMSRVNRMARNFNPALLRLLEVNWRADDTYAVLDGGHRLMMARALGFKMLRCRVHIGLSVQEEADRYYELNSSEKGLNGHDKWKANLFAGHPDAVALDRLTKKHGYEIRRGSTNPNAIQAVDALRSEFAKGGPVVIDRVLRTMRTCWPEDVSAREATIVSGLSAFYRTYPEVSDKDLFPRLIKVGPVQILQAVVSESKTMMVGTGSNNRPTLAARSITRLYNKGRRTGKLDWRWGTDD